VNQVKETKKHMGMEKHKGHIFLQLKITCVPRLMKNETWEQAVNPQTRQNCTEQDTTRETNACPLKKYRAI
jgi:hypothetical protein